MCNSKPSIWKFGTRMLSSKTNFWEVVMSRRNPWSNNAMDTGHSRRGWNWSLQHENDMGVPSVTVTYKENCMWKLSSALYSFLISATEHLWAKVSGSKCLWNWDMRNYRSSWLAKRWILDTQGAHWMKLKPAARKRFYDVHQSPLRTRRIACESWVQRCIVVLI